MRRRATTTRASPPPSWSHAARAGYPPFGRLVRLTFAHPNPRVAREEALRLQRALSHRRAELGSDADVLGPSPAYVPRVRGRWRWQLLLRGRDPAALVRDFVLPAELGRSTSIR